MSEGLNRCMFFGNLGADPELRYTQGGQAVLNLRLAINETYLDKDKVRRERVEWIPVVVWGKRGEALGKILGKGSSIFVEGSMRTTKFQDRDGKDRWKTEVNATNVFLAGGRGRASSADADGFAAPEPRPASRSVGQRGATAPEPPADDYASGGYGGDDDIPFLFIGAAPESDTIPRSWL